MDVTPWCYKWMDGWTDGRMDGWISTKHQIPFSDQHVSVSVIWESLVHGETNMLRCSYVWSDIEHNGVWWWVVHIDGCGANSAESIMADMVVGGWCTGLNLEENPYRSQRLCFVFFAEIFDIVLRALWQMMVGGWVVVDHPTQLICIWIFIC